MTENAPYIITRPPRDAERFLAAVRAAGGRAIAMPVIDIHFHDDVPIAPRNWQAVAITSANGARAIARRADRTAIIRAPAVCVGPASTRAAIAAGFLHILQAARGDVEGVIVTIRTRLDPSAGPILYTSGAITRGALEERLAADGFEVVRHVLYEARPVKRLSTEAEAALRAGPAGTVALYSPRSARIWARLVHDAGLAEAARHWHHACLSANVAGALQQALPAADNIAVAPRPEEGALLRMLGLPDVA